MSQSEITLAVAEFELEFGGSECMQTIRLPGEGFVTAIVGNQSQKSQS